MVCNYLCSPGYYVIFEFFPRFILGNNDKSIINQNKSGKKLCTLYIKITKETDADSVAKNMSHNGPCV